MSDKRKEYLRSFIDGNEEVLGIADDFQIFSRRAIHHADYLFKTKMCICCICLQGSAMLRINLSDCRLEADSLCISMAGQILEMKYMSDDFEGVCILMSERFISNLGLPFSLDVHRSVLEAPVIVLTDRQLDAMMSYCDMVRRVLKNNHPNKSEIVRHLTCAFFYGIGYYFHKATAKAVSNDEDLVRRFLDEVEKNYRRERKVLYYADRLHITAKYLSAVVKGYSGKTASEWIDDYVVLEAKALLKSTNMTISQISEELNFPSQSFFGKYFRRITGMSPKSFRNGL